MCYIITRTKYIKIVLVVVGIQNSIIATLSNVTDLFRLLIHASTLNSLPFN